MSDFRLKVFQTVANRMNFTKAAEELNITQPAVTKHVQEIERQYKTKLFDRNGTKVKLTDAGNILLRYTNQLFEIYRELEFEVGALNHKHKGTLRMGASTTIAQYILPQVLASFHSRFKDIRISLYIHNSETIEQLLEEKDIDLGIVEGQSRSKSFHYTRFIKDEIVLAARESHSLRQKKFVKAEDIKKIPLVLRESGSGTLETILYALKPLGIRLSDLNIEMRLGSTESIKTYLLHSECTSFLSIYSILNELSNKTMGIIDVKNLSIERYFYFIQLQGDQSPITDLFIKFSGNHDYK